MQTTILKELGCERGDEGGQGADRMLAFALGVYFKVGEA